jgi:hypothetical protein
MRKVPVLAAALAIALSVIQASAFEPLEPRPVHHGPGRHGSGPARSHYVIAAAGDIACESDPLGAQLPGLCQYDDTADLIANDRFAEVLLLGDNQYERGAYAAYTQYFDPTWGRTFANLSPAPGNHEYGDDVSSTPRGYFRYFGRRVKGPDGLGYYSFDLGACPDAPCWHLISLNSELCFAPGGCGPAEDPTDPGPGNRMHAWLEKDLAAHPDAEYPCTLAYWHHPRFSFSTGSGATSAVGPLWSLLYAASADLVLSGHSHNYQRWRPQDPQGALDRGSGIREFVVGTGGRSHYAIPDQTAPDNLVKAQAHAFGILRLTLRSSSYRWRWISAAGQPAFEDAPEHAVRCVRASP